MFILSQLKKGSSLFLNSMKIALDIGSSFSRIAIFDKGIVLREPTIIAINSKNNNYLFFGREAKEIQGKSPPYINIVKPIKHGIISDFDAFVNLISYFLEKSVKPYLKQKSIFKPQIEAFATIPSSSTEVEQKALIDGLNKVGFHTVRLIEKPLATSAGVGHLISSQKPIFIVDFGGGLIEASVISLGGIVINKVLKQAGDHLDRLIINYLHLKYGLIIGSNTAENLKIELFNFLNDNEKTITVRGKSLESQMPKSIRVKSDDIKESLYGYFNLVLDLIKDVLEACPPEIINEIVNTGIYFTGGLATIKGIDRFFSTDLKIPVILSENQNNCTINGILSLIKNNDQKYFLH